MASITFDATQHDPNAADFDPIPNGTYRVVVKESAEKANKSGQGKHLAFTFEIVEGPHAGRLVWDRINHFNANATAQKLGQAKLSQLCHAVGVLQPRDTIELHSIPLFAEVVCAKRADKPGEMTNEVKKYMSAQGPASQPAAAATPAGNSDAAPWENK